MHILIYERPIRCKLHKLIDLNDLTYLQLTEHKIWLKKVNILKLKHIFNLKNKNTVNQMHSIILFLNIKHLKSFNHDSKPIHKLKHQLDRT